MRERQLSAPQQVGGESLRWGGCWVHAALRLLGQQLVIGKAGGTFFHHPTML